MANVLEKGKYFFDPADNVVGFNLIDFDITKVKAITNLTTGDLIYCPQAGLLGYADDNDRITLVFDTTAMSTWDDLQIIYDWEANYHKCFDNSFSLAVSDGVDGRDMYLLQAGSGQTVNQANGNLLITCGTTANAETIIRSNDCFSREMLANIILQRSQAIAGNKLLIALADVIGDGLHVNVSSATIAVVSIPKSNAYYQKFKAILDVSDTGMVGMKMTMGSLSVVGAIPSRYAITSASYDSNNVYLSFAVSGFTAGKSGNCTLYGWNFISMYFTGPSTYAVNFDCARNGYSSNLGYGSYGSTSVPNTTAPAIYALHKNSEQVMCSYATVTSGASLSQLASRATSIPSEETKLYLHIVSRNDPTPPATETTFTILGVRVEEMNAQPVQINGAKVLSGGGNGYAVPMYCINQVGSLSVSSMSVSTTSGGVSTRFKQTSAATTNLTLVKNSAGTLNGGIVTNVGSTTVYFKLYNKASAPVLTSDIPVYTIAIPAGGCLDINALTGTVGDRFTTGIAYAITGGYADNDATAIAAGQVFTNLNYA